MMQAIIEAGCRQWGLDITPQALARMEQFSDLLLEKNRVMNLTAITEPEEVARRHMLDSLFLLTCTSFAGKKILDIGCGPGFPSMPLLCFDPSLDITALDSTAKRIQFILDSCQTMGLTITGVAARAEEYVAKGQREQYDVVISRAVAALPVLCELCLPYVKPGGLFLPLKSDNESAQQEIAASQKALGILGGKLIDQRRYTIEGMDTPHQVLVIEKAAPTPGKYPRRYAKIVANPL